VIDLHGRFVWYELMTTDVRGAMAFYSKVMGWRAWDASTSDRRYILFSAGPASVSGVMELTKEARDLGANSNWLGYVGVDDVDATTERIKSFGGVVHVPPVDAGDISRFSIFSDPQAARLALLKWLRPGLQRPVERAAPGRVGWHELLAAEWAPAWQFYSEVFGWRKVEKKIVSSDGYHLFSAAGETIGGMFSKELNMPGPFWLYYFNVDDIHATIGRLETAGGEIVHGPVEVTGGNWIAQCRDPQGALFGLEGARRPDPLGYFPRAPSPDRSNDRRCSWSW